MFSNPYVLATIFCILIGIVLFITTWPHGTLIQNNPTSGEDPLQKKELWAAGRQWNKRKRKVGCIAWFVLVALAFSVAFGWLNVPVVMAALQPTATPTITPSPTITPTPYYTRTLGPSPVYTWTAGPTFDGTGQPPTSIPTPTAQVIVHTVVQTRVVVQTRIVYQSQLITTTPVPTQTPWILYYPVTETPSPTATQTETPTASETSTPTETATP
jgi:hypothetical protein